MASKALLESKRVSVTGGGGFLGSFVANRLRRRGWCSEVFVPRSRDYDLRDQKPVDGLYEDTQPDIGVHPAGVVSGIEYGTLAELVQAVIDVSGQRIGVEYVEAPVRVHSRNSDKARSHSLGSEARVPLREGIARTYR